MKKDEKFIMGKTTFTDEAEAVAMADELNKNFTTEKICPLMIRECDPKCVCFVPAFPYINSKAEDGGKLIHIGGLKCGNAMYHGNKPIS